ncbi:MULTISPECIES: ComF family protein [unclassified Isoptericola]|uniref:ComF family protein n=1 Tax=unclassified Isoptericola TaxID=2623355 RepID=UPI00364B0CC8
MSPPSVASPARPPAPPPLAPLSGAPPGPRPAPAADPRRAGEWLRELGRLVVPVACPGCGAPDVLWCPDCGALLDGPAARVEAAAPRLDRLDGVPPLPVWALAPYAGPVRELVVAWKDRGRVDLDRLVGPRLRAVARDLAPALRGAVRGRSLLVVGAPSTGASRRSRGRDHVRALTRAAGAGLRDAGLPAGVVAALVRRGRGHDQVGLGARARARNLTGSVAVRRGVVERRDGAPAAVLLVDDVVTTGSTLAAAERALEGVGADVVGALVVAATPPPGAVTRPVTDLPQPPVYLARGRG